MSSDPLAVLSSGNMLLVLAFLIVILASVVVYQQRRIDLLYKQLFDENKLHVADYREMAKSNQEVLQVNSQANSLLAAKIEAVRGK